MTNLDKKKEIKTKMAKVLFEMSDEERADAKQRAADLGMNLSELIRSGLKKMGVKIEVEKSVGAPVGNKNNPRGNPNFGKKTE